MPIEVELPDGSIVEFPDGTDNATMERALAQYGQQQPWQPKRRTADDLRREGKGFDPTEGNSALQNALISYGKSYVDTGRGIKQLFGGMTQAEVDRAREVDAPLMDAPGSTLGNIAGQTVQLFTPLPVSGAAKGLSVLARAAPYARAAAQSGAFASLQPVATGESRLGNAAEGAAWGALGQGLASGASRLASAAGERISPVVRESIEMARRAGIPLNVSQVTESPVIKAMQSATKYLPFSGAASSARGQQEAFNEAVAKSFGADAGYLTDDVMRGARGRMSKAFEDIYSRNNVTMTEFPLRRMADIEREAMQNLEAGRAQVVRNQLEKVLRELPEDGILSGKKYQSLRDSLKRAEDGGQIGHYVKQIRQTLDEAAATSVGAADAALLKGIRGAWANLRTTEDALKQVAGAGGNVRPSALWPLIRNGSTKEMRELARIGQNVLKDGIGDSGTAQRDFWMRTLGGAGAASTAAGLGMLPLLAKGVAGGALAGRALNSNVASRLLEQGKPTKGLASLLKRAPKYLPPAGMAATNALELDVAGGRVGTPEEIARDAAIAEEFRRQGR